MLQQEKKMPRVGKNRKLTLQSAKSMIDELMMIGDDNEKSELIEHLHKWMFALESGMKSVSNMNNDDTQRYHQWREQIGRLKTAQTILNDQFEQDKLEAEKCS